MTRVLKLGEHRVAMCARFAISGQKVTVRRSGSDASFGGLQTCGSLLCAVCGARIRHGRAQEIREIAAAHTLAGGGLLFGTLTVPHTRAMGAAETLRVVSAARDALVNGRAAQTLKRRFGISGRVWVVDVTHGPRGWHPHLHLLLLVDRPWDDLSRVADLTEHLHQVWARVVEKHGYRRPSVAHGVRVLPCRDDAAALGTYLAKLDDGFGDIAAELGGAGKVGRPDGHRTPAQLAYDGFVGGDAQAQALWHEWARASHQKRMIGFSAGLRCLLGDSDRTDDEIAAEPEEGQVLAYVSPVVRRSLWWAGADAEFLDVAGREGLPGVTRWLDEHGLGRLVYSGAGPPWIQPPEATAVRGVRATTCR